MSDSYEIYLKKLREKLAEAAKVAQPLAKAGKFEEAEAIVRKVDGDIQGGVALARMYEAELREVLAQKKADKAAVAGAYERALKWAQYCYPEPHTGEEADRYREGQQEDRAKLIALVGYDPME